MILRRALLAPVCLALFCLGSLGTAHAQQVISTEYGDVFVMTFEEYLDKENRPVCGKLPRVINYKAFQSQDNQNFTEREYLMLAGDAPFLALRGHDWWYSRDQRKQVSWDELYAIYGSFDSGNYDQLPVLCGVVTAQSSIASASADPVVSWKNGTQGCNGAFCGLSGGAYLQAIYENDLDLIKRFDASIHRTLRQKLGAILSLSEDLGEKPQDFSLLPALANAYLVGYANGFGASCGDELVRKVVTKKTPTYDMFDQDGLYEGQGGGEVYRFTYVLKPGLVPLCDDVCDSLGGRAERSAVRTLSHGGATRTLNGIDELFSRYGCSAEEITRFEQNLVAMTRLYLDERYRWLPTPAAPAVARVAPKDPAAERNKAAENRASGMRYLEKNRALGDVSTTSSGLQYTILKRGEGRHPSPTDRVVLLGVGELIDGRRMDDSYTAGTSVDSMSSLMPGLREGLQLIKPGGKVRLVIPPELAFGDREVGMIKPGSTLVYELELVSIVE